MKLETNPKVLQRQQVILAFLGYYKGKLDGIWGKESINAKKDFEVSGKFAPGLPNRGLPFVNTDSMPKGVFADPFNKGLLSAKGLSEEDISRMIQEKGEHTGNAVAKNVEAPIIDKPKVEETSVVNNVEEPDSKEEVITKETIDTKPDDVKSEKPAEKPIHPSKPKKNPNSNQRHRHHN